LRTDAVSALCDSSGQVLRFGEIFCLGFFWTGIFAGFVVFLQGVLGKQVYRMWFFDG
jgi:hypothetical protein